MADFTFRQIRDDPRFETLSPEQRLEVSLKSPEFRRAYEADPERALTYLGGPAPTEPSEGGIGESLVRGATRGFVGSTAGIAQDVAGLAGADVGEPLGERAVRAVGLEGEPATPGQRIAETAGEYAGTAAGWLLPGFGAAKLAARGTGLVARGAQALLGSGQPLSRFAAGELAGGVTSGVGAGIAREVAPESMLAEVGGALLGGIPGAMVAGRVATRLAAPARTLRESLPKESAEILDRAQELGLTNAVREAAEGIGRPEIPSRAALLPGRRLYREMGSEEALSILDPSTHGATPFGHEVFLAEAPELALGQGASRGIKVELSDVGLDLKRAKHKPGLEYGREAGLPGEFTTLIGDPKQLAPNVQKVDIDFDVLGKTPYARRLRNIVHNPTMMGKAGFDVSRAGSITSLVRRSKPALPGMEDTRALAQAAVGPPIATKKPAGMSLAAITDNESVANVLEQSARQGDEFILPRKIPQTWEETAELAEKQKRLYAITGLTPDEVLRRRPNAQPLMAHETWGMVNRYEEFAGELTEMAKTVAATPGDKKLAGQFQRAFGRFQGFQEHLQAAVSEGARSLAVLRSSAAKRRSINELVRTAEKYDVNELARLILEAPDVESLSRAMRGVTKWDKVGEGWKAMLLTNPQTWSANAISNLGYSFLNTAETLTAATITAPWRAARRLAGRPVQDAATFTDVGADLMGWLEGSIEGAKAIGHRMKTGQVSPKLMASGVEKAEIGRQAIGGRFGEAVRLPFQVLSATDDFFKSVASTQSLYRDAARMTKGLRGQERLTRMRQLIADPTKEMRTRAGSEAAYRTFTQTPGDLTRKIMGLRNVESGPVRLAANVVLPFLATPSNIFKATFARTPAALLTKEFRDAWKAGGRAKQQALARIGFGSAVGAWAAWQAAQGNLTGSPPEDEATRAQWRDADILPYSIKIGDTWHSYQRAGQPLGAILGSAADFVRHPGDPTATVVGIAHNFLDNTFMQGLAGVVNALTDPERYGEKWLQRTVGSFVPAGVAGVARVMDPTIRAPEGVGEALAARIPGLAQNVPPRIGLTGEEARYSGSLGPDILSPIYTSREEDTPGRRVAQEMLAVEADTGPIRKQLLTEKLGDMTREELELYQRRAGTKATEIIARRMESPSWARLSPALRKDFIETVFRRVRTSEKRRTIAERYRSRRAAQ